MPDSCNRSNSKWAPSSLQLITLISLFQRYLYNNYTFLQLIIGFTVGGGFGYLTYIIGNKYISGNINMKMDENGPL